MNIQEGIEKRWKGRRKRKEKGGKEGSGTCFCQHQLENSASP